LPVDDPEGEPLGLVADDPEGEPLGLPCSVGEPLGLALVPVALDPGDVPCVPLGLPVELGLPVVSLGLLGELPLVLPAELPVDCAKATPPNASGAATNTASSHPLRFFMCTSFALKLHGPFRHQYQPGAPMKAGPQKGSYQPYGPQPKPAP
jgi:hypothetical protein